MIPSLISDKNMTNLIDNKVTLAIKLAERNHVEKPLLDQLASLGWEILDLDSKQQSSKLSLKEANEL